jgi:NADPH-dependent curcumin reductase CurA
VDLSKIKNQQWIYTKRPVGDVTAEHYQLLTKPLDKACLCPGEILIAAKYISVDPYMRVQQSANTTWEDPHPIGSVQQAGVVGEVVAVGNPSGLLKIGDFVRTYSGWQRYAICNEANVKKLDPKAAPLSTVLGVLGMPGLTAYFGLLDVGKPQAGETVVVSGAAGAVGAVVAQIAKLKGCRVIGIAGSKSKIDYLVNELGIDAAINYKDHVTPEAISSALKENCPNGIDVYFDNVGGFISDAIFPLINLRARIIICGQISQYNEKLDQPEPSPRFLHHILYKRATIQGILARDYADRYNEMLAKMGPWVREGKVKYRETIIEGFDNLPNALNVLMNGKNTGKLMVQL